MMGINIIDANICHNFLHLFNIQIRTVSQETLHRFFGLKIYILFPGRNVQRIDDRVFESNTLSGKTYMAHFFRRVADDKFWYFQEPKSTLVTPCLVAIKGRDDRFQLHLPPYLTPQYQWRTVFTCVSVLTPVFDTYDLLLLQKGLFLPSLRALERP